ncbi:hypothetical protein [Neoaquamicrobium sediminum]
MTLVANAFEKFGLRCSYWMVAVEKVVNDLIIGNSQVLGVPNPRLLA